MMSYEHLSPEFREIAIKRQMEFNNFSFNGKDDGADMSDWDDPVKLKEIAKCYEDEQKRKQSKNVYNTPLDSLECFRVSQTPITQCMNAQCGVIFLKMFILINLAIFVVSRC